MLGINPRTVPALYDFAVIAGRKTPGVAIVSGFKLPWEWEKKKGKGSSGASVTSQGEDLSDGTLKLLLWRSGGSQDDGIDDFAEWDDLREYLILQIRGGGKDPKALDFTHPYTTDLGISSVYVKSIGQVTREGNRGLHSVTIELGQFRAPQKAGGTPKASTGKQWQDSAKSKQEKEIEDLLKKAQAA